MTKTITLPSWLTESVRSEFADLSAPQADLARLQSEYKKHFLESGFPTTKQERWKYTDVTFLAQRNFSPAVCLYAANIQELVAKRKLGADKNQQQAIQLVFVNGFFVRALSALEQLPAEINLRHLKAMCEDPLAVKEVLATCKSSEEPLCPFANLNTAEFTDGLFLTVADNCKLNTTIHLLFIATETENFVAHTKHILKLGVASQLNIVEETVSLGENAYFTNSVLSMQIEKNAQLNYCKLQHENKNATHQAHYFIEQRDNSEMVFTAFSLGAKFSRDEVIVNLQGNGACCQVNGFYRTNENAQYVDHHVDIFHLAPRTRSAMFYKGIADKKSRAVFNGKLTVKHAAQKIVAHQANHNLLLSNESEVYAKPELEIYTDDVKCQHGATTGQLDTETLFYLRARGIPEKEAMIILLRAFAEEVLQRIAHPGLRSRAEELISC